MEVVFQAAGHPHVRATHAKSIEFTAAADISLRATCVIGVRAVLPVEQLRRLRGRVRIEITTLEAQDSIVGEINPYFNSTQGAVIRRSEVLSPDTLVVNASHGASQLSCEIVNQLRHPDAALTIRVRELEKPPPVVVVVLPFISAVDLSCATEFLLRNADRIVDFRSDGKSSLDSGIAGLLGQKPTRQGPSEEELAGARILVVLLDSLGVTETDPRVRALFQRLRAMSARWILSPPDRPAAQLLLAAGYVSGPIYYLGDIPSKRKAQSNVLARIRASSEVSVLGLPSELASEALVGALSAALGDRILVLADPHLDWGTAAAPIRGAELTTDVLPAALRRDHHLAVLPHPNHQWPSVVVSSRLLAERLHAAGLSRRSINGILADLGFGHRLLYRPGNNTDEL